jgi:N6-adenosine-specific RNA methylase IME4
MQFDIVLADPPWSFKTWSDKGKDRSPDYGVMTLDQLRSLPIKDITAPNAALFMWCCWPFIFRDALPLIESWGFTYRTCAFVWIKAKRKGKGFHMGLGYYTRANTEVCLLAVKGKMPVADHGVSQVIFSRVREHSRKPDEQYELIERLYPSGSYLELFAREKHSDKWLTWGFEAPDGMWDLSA